MRYRLMASYLGASYQAAVGPTDRDVTLFAAPPPPEAHGFSPVPGGIWRKQVRVSELDALWESRPIGSYHGEPCLVLDDLGDRLHVVYLGTDERRAGQLGYWQVDRGVFEVVVARHEVTDLAEEQHEFTIALLLSSLPRALSAGGTGAGSGGNGAMADPGRNGMSGQQPVTKAYRLPAGTQQSLPQGPGGPPGMPGAVPGSQAWQPVPNAPQLPAGGQFPGAASFGPPPAPDPLPQPPATVVGLHGSPAADGKGMWYYQPADLQPQQNGLTHNGLTHNAMNGSAQTQVQPATLAWPGPLPAPLPAQDPRTAGGTVTANVTARPAAQAAAPIASPPLSAPPMTAAPAGSPERTATGPLPAAAANKADQADQAPATGLRAGGALSKLTGTVRGRRAARKPRLAMSAIFADLVDLAHLPRSAYAVDEEVTGAMCLFKTEGGYEVFSCAEDARHEVRFFEDEEAAYFYLFGVLAAEALRNGRLSPRQR